MSATTFSFSAVRTDEAQAVARGLRKRDPALLERLIELYQYRLFRYLVHICGNREVAEDAFQETWVRVLDRGNQYDGNSRFETWLFTIARNLVIDIRRRKTPECLDELVDEGAALPPAGGLSPLELAAQQERRAGLNARVAALPTIYREVLVLRFQEDLQLDEIAAVTAIPVSTVKSRLYRGLEMLRQVVKGADR